MSDRRATRLGAAFIVPILLLVGCGGGAASTSPGASVAESSPAGDTSPSGGASPSDFVLPSGMVFPSDAAIPSFDLGALTHGLDNVDSYKIAIVTTSGKDYSGTVVTKPVLSRDLYIGTGDSATHLVTIGDESWLGTGTGPLASAPSALVAGMLPLFDPAVLLAIFGNATITSFAQDLGTETKNGQPTTHYKVDPTKLPTGLMSFPATAAMEFWVADDGYLVSFTATDFGQVGSNLSIDVTNVNDPTNVVAHP